MINEVINTTDESVKTDEAVLEEETTTTENSVEVKTEETSASIEEPKTEPIAPVEPAPAEVSTSMAEMDFGAILEEFEQDQEVYHTGKFVEGIVVGISDRGVLIDFGYKSEGVVPSDELTSPEGELTVKEGDTVEVVIKNIYSGDAPPVLSHLEAIARKSWDVIETAFNEETPITVRVVSKTKGGLRVDINGVEAFLPGSQVDSRPIRNLDSFRDKEIEVKVIKFSRKRNNIVVSRKVLTDEVVNVQKAETLSKIEPGHVVEGVVKNLTEYGAFVDLGGIDGLLHVTDMSWGRLQNPNEMFKVNDNIQVKILKLDREREKVSLGFKQLLPDPWSTVVEVYPVDSTVTGTVSSVTDYGAFVELESGVEGLVHISEMSWSKRTKSPKKLVTQGEEVEVQVLGIDTEERRISLGMKQLQENPWDTIAERYQVGSKVRGKVRNLTDFGAFVEIEDGVDGLVHVSDISHSKKIKHPKDVLKRDQEVEAIVTNIDTQGHRLSLSIKELTPSTWDEFADSHKPGDLVKGKVSRFAGFGVFVELGNDLEGLCHISELSDDRVEKPEDVVSIGQELDFKILRIEHDVQKIGLSHRAVGKEEEPIVDTKSYSTEAKGGMASLGELMNLKRGGEGSEEEEAVDSPKLSKKERRAKRALEQAESDDELGIEEGSAESDSSSPSEETSAEESSKEETLEIVEVVEAIKTEADAPDASVDTIEEAEANESDASAEATDEVEAVEAIEAETDDESDASAQTTEVVDAGKTAEPKQKKTKAAKTLEVPEQSDGVETKEESPETTEIADKEAVSETTEPVESKDEVKSEDVSEVIEEEAVPEENEESERKSA